MRRQIMDRDDWVTIKTTIFMPLGKLIGYWYCIDELQAKLNEKAGEVSATLLDSSEERNILAGFLSTDIGLRRELDNVKGRIVSLFSNYLMNVVAPMICSEPVKDPSQILIQLVSLMRQHGDTVTAGGGFDTFISKHYSVELPTNSLGTIPEYD